MHTGSPLLDDDDPFLDSDPGPLGFDSGSDAYNDPYSSDLGFDIDVPLSTINVFAAQQRARPPPNSDPSIRLPDSIFSKMSQDDKRAWSRLSGNARRLILGYSGSSSTAVHPGSSVMPPSSGLSTVNRRVHMAEHSPLPILTPDGLGTPTVSPATSTAMTTYDPAHEDSQDSTRLLAMMTQQHHPGDLRRLLSTSSARPPPDPGPRVSTRSVNMARTNVVARADAAHRHRSQLGALVDRGANGGLAGQDCRIIARAPDHFVNIEGLDRHQLTNIPIVSCGAYTVSRNHGPVIVVFHQFAGVMRGPTIISSGQLESFHNQVNERSRRVDPHGQLIITNDGYEFPLHVRNGLSYLDLRPFTDQEFQTLPHVIMTSDVDWDPSILDGEYPLTGQEEFLDASMYDNGTAFDASGDYRNRSLGATARVSTAAPAPRSPEPAVAPTVDDEAGDIPMPVGFVCGDEPQEPRPPAEPPPDTPDDDHPVFTNVSPHIAKATVDPAHLRPFFAFLPTEVVARTLERTTQYARVPMRDRMHRFYKSPFPALNVARRNEDLLTYIIYSDTPAIDDGATSAALFSAVALLMSWMCLA